MPSVGDPLNFCLEKYWNSVISQPRVYSFMNSEASIHVLHVDDEPDFAELTAEFLKREDDSITVTTATSASEGLEHLSRGDFDCIVSDYDMPTQNGIEFLKSVRENSPDLPFVLFTGKGSEEIAGEAISAGVTDYLQKKRVTDQYTVLANRLRNAVERHRAEKERKRQRKAIETAQEGISILNQDGEYIYVNQAYADIYGYDPDEMEGEHWELIYPDGDTAIARDVILPTVAEDGYWSGETTGLRADGTTFVEDHTITQTDTNGLICSVRDRSVKQEREIALTQFQTLVETLNDPVYVLDETGQFEYVNDAFIEMVGYDRERIIGASPALIKSAEAVDRSEDHLGQVLSSNGPDSVQFEIEVQPATGEPISCEDHMGVLPYEGESFEGSVGVLRDISERKERKQELERINTVLRTVIENLPMGALVEDAERDVLMANDQLGETLGVPVDGEELIGRDCAMAAEELKFRFTDPEMFVDGITERLEQREPVQNEELHLADGRVIERDYVPYTLPEGDASVWLYQDVTARKQQEQELERTNEFLSQTQSVADIGSWEYDLQTESLRWTDEVYRIHGVNMDFEPTVEDAVEFYHPKDRATIQDAFERVTTDGEPYDVELRIVTADDEVRWVRSRGEPRGENGEIVGACGTFQDITGRIERERELREEQAFIERSLDALEDIFYFVDPDGEFQRWNSTLSELTGYSDEEIGSMNALKFFDGKHREALSRSTQEILETGSNVTEAEITTADGRRVPHEFRSVRMTNDDGELMGIIGIARDITERRERERQLKQQTEELEQLATKYERQYRTLFEEAPVMTILTRSEDGQPIIEDCNSQFVETLGYDADTITGSELAEFYTPESAERLRSKGYSRAVNGQFNRAERELLTTDGETIEALLRAVPRRTADGETIGTVAMYVDISERESVKRANERLKEFTSVVSHDLRNPLNVATGRLKLAVEECDSNHLGEVEDALGRMEALIDELLTLAREGKEVTDTQPVDLATIADECWENVKTNQAKLMTNTDQGVQADRGRLKQVFENLFRNAVEHGRADVTVTIGGLDDGFYVEDDGPGIPSDERDAVFEAGYSKSTDGTGFGLSIVEQIVTAHDWHIRVTDGVDGGARFEVTNVECMDR